jgi:hypothetical protein
MVARIVAAAVAAVLAGTLEAQVFKCVDVEGRTTYQQAPCAKDVKGARIELDPDNGRTQDPAALEAQWAVAVKAGQVMAGMPKAARARRLWCAHGGAGGHDGRARDDRGLDHRNPGGVRRIGFLDAASRGRGDDASSAPPPPTRPAIPLRAALAGSGVARRPASADSTRVAIAAGADTLGLRCEAQAA